MAKVLTVGDLTTEPRLLPLADSISKLILPNHVWRGLFPPPSHYTTLAIILLIGEILEMLSLEFWFAFLWLWVRQIIHTYVRVTCVQICVGKDTHVAWRMGEAEKAGSGVIGGYTSGGTQRALPCCPSTSEELGISNSFLGHGSSGTPSSLPSLSGLLETTPTSPQGLWLLQTALEPELPLPCAPDSLLPPRGPMAQWELQFCPSRMAAWVSPAGCILCSELGLQRALLFPEPPHPDVFLDKSGWRIKLENSLVGKDGTSHLLHFNLEPSVYSMNQTAEQSYTHHLPRAWAKEQMVLCDVKSADVNQR